MDTKTIDHIRAVLERDVAWSGYALADLDPEHREHCEWTVGRRSAILLYKGLQPPILFAQGDPAEIGTMAGEVNSGPCQYTLTGTYRAAFGERLDLQTESKMWRMVLRRRRRLENPGHAERMHARDADEIESLWAGHLDRPDAYHRRQLDNGIHYGVRREGNLVAIAGTHVLSLDSNLAAIGNVFTHPDHRGQGYARLTSTAVLQALLEMNIETILLNVAMENDRAMRLYQDLGFAPYCGYYEGEGEIRND